MERSKELQLLERIMYETTDQSDLDSLMKIAKIVYKHDSKERNSTIERLTHLAEGVSGGMVSMSVKKDKKYPNNYEIHFIDSIDKNYLGLIDITRVHSQLIYQGYRGALKR